MNGFALGLSLKRRLRATWKWAIQGKRGGFHGNYMNRNHLCIQLQRASICDPPRENQQKGDNTGTRAMHGHASVTTDTDMRIFNEKTESVMEAFVWQDITR